MLITGETGTGKELIAQAIHDNSSRADKPFISVNCAAVPPSLIAAELFGHEKGAYTGADRQRLGRFELAANGTLFLDEIGELPQEMQASLLRVLEERTIERLGGTKSIPVDGCKDYFLIVQLRKSTFIRVLVGSSLSPCLTFRWVIERTITAG